MNPRTLLDTLLIAERLKDTARHCVTGRGMPETVAAHSWMMTLMALLMRDEFPEADMDKVIRMCVIHDIGECFTGDIPVFNKSEAHEAREERLLNDWVQALPAPYAQEFAALYAEMDARETLEAKIYKCIDGLEAVIQHNISDIATWLPNEYDLNLTYCDDRVQFSPYLSALREEIRKDTLRKIEDSQ